MKIHRILLDACPVHFLKPTHPKLYLLCFFLPVVNFLKERDEGLHFSKELFQNRFM